MLSRNLESGLIASYLMFDKIASITLFKSDPTSRRTLRFAIGMVVMFAIVFLINWPLSFLFIVFGSTFLLGTKPSWKFAFSFISKFAYASIAAIIICYLFIDFPLLYLLVMGLLLLHLFYAQESTIDHLLKTAISITFVVIPLVWLKEPMLGLVVGFYLVLGVSLSVITAIILFELMPDLNVANEDSASAHGHTSEPSTKKDRFRKALKSLMVIFPIIVLFYFFNLQAHLLIIVFVIILADNPDFANDLSVANNKVKTTFIGGFVAVCMYELLVIVPNFTFFMLMVFGLALYAGYQMITGGKYATNIGGGLSATIIIFVGVGDSIEGDAEAKAWLRVIQMTVLVIYVILNFKLFEKLFPQTKKVQSHDQES